MRRWLFIIMVIVPVLTQAQIKPFVVPDSLIRSDDLVRVGLLDHAVLLTGPAVNLNPSQLLGQQFDGRFRTLSPNFRYKKDSVHWLKLRLSNQSSQNFEGLINFGYLIKKVTVYQEEDGNILEMVTGGFVSPKDKEIIHDFVFSFIPIEISPKKDKDVLIKIETGRVKSHVVPIMRLFNQLPVFEEWSKLQIRSIVFVTVIASLIFFNLCLFVITKERLYATYILWCMAIGAFMSCLYFFPYFFNGFTALRVTLISQNLCSFFLGVFTLNYLNLRASKNILHVIFKNFLLVPIALILPSLYEIIVGVLHGLLVNELTFLSFALVGIFITVIGIQLSIRKESIARYFLVSTLPFLLAVIVGSMLYLIRNTELGGGWQMRYVLLTVTGIGSTVMIVLQGLAIGYRIIRLRKDKSQAVQDKLKTQENINVQLEQKVTERTSQLEHRNRENELLLGEIHHRVKNNLQVISSLLKLQSRQLEEGKAKSAVLEGRDRVKAMALIHQRLYQQDQFSAIEMHDYVKNLAANLAQSYGYGNTDFELDLTVPEIHLDVDSAIPLGLIINELVSNTFKHAFEKGKENRLSINLHEEVNSLILEVQDNGPGMIAKSKEASSFGLQLIEALTEELKGQVIYENGQGTSVRLIIKEYKILATT